MSLNDWNHNGKKDGVDQFIDFQVYKETEKIHEENGKRNEANSINAGSNMKKAASLIIWIIFWVVLLGLLRRL